MLLAPGRCLALHLAVPPRLAALLCAVALGPCPTLSAGQAANELLAALQTRLVAGKPLDDLTEALEQLENREFKDLTADLDRAWPKLRDGYLQALGQIASTSGGGASENRSRVRELRAEFMRVKGLGEGAMKAELKKVSMPALQELQRLLTPTPDQLVAAGGQSLAALQQSAKSFARFRDQALDAALSTTASDSVSSLADAEQKIARDHSGLDRDGLRILEKNRNIAEDDQVPADEAAGIEECNLWRLYLGLNALTLDPKLCNAARDHSKDMAEKGFFAHDSPVPGKGTPWARAKLAGTTASAENIYAGGSNPAAANRGWFFSPGHHKNMFGGHRRIGLGHYRGKWTQMFGR